MVPSSSKLSKPVPQVVQAAQRKRQAGLRRGGCMFLCACGEAGDGRAAVEEHALADGRGPPARSVGPPLLPHVLIGHQPWQVREVAAEQAHRDAGRRACLPCGPGAAGPRMPAVAGRHVRASSAAHRRPQLRALHAVRDDHHGSGSRGRSRGCARPARSTELCTEGLDLEGNRCFRLGFWLGSLDVPQNSVFCNSGK